MPDQLSESRRDVRVPVAQAVAILALFAALGVGAGYLWFRLWDAPSGVVANHSWYPDPFMPGQQAAFDAVALYVLLATLAGVLGGLLCAFVLDRDELVTLAALTVGSLLAAWLMATVGSALGPADPDVLARTAADGTRLPGDLGLTGLTPYVALPAGALGALVVVFFATIGRRPR